MASKANKATGARKIAVTMKVRKALDLRLAGHTLAEIARACGYHSEAAVHIAIKTALDRTIREVSEEVRALEVARLDKMLAALWEQAMGGQPEYIDRVLKIMQRRASLLGLDMPQKVAPTMPDGETTYAPSLHAAPSQDFFVELAGLFQHLGPQHVNGSAGPSLGHDVGESSN